LLALHVPDQADCQICRRLRHCHSGQAGTSLAWYESFLHDSQRFFHLQVYVPRMK